jgi:LuxR family maltose regulon positive regulatory protein
LSRAHLLGRQGRPDDTISILEVLQRETEAAQHRYFAIRSAIHLSAAELNAGRAADAVNRFRRVLTACAAAGLYQSILDEGPIIDQILRMTQINGHLGADLISYVDRLMTGVEGARQARLAPTSRPQLLGALSPRETDILQLIAHGLSNKEIARRLDIGPETVKSHLKGVFTKLGVERRSQAVSRAQTLGLVITE